MKAAETRADRRATELSRPLTLDPVFSGAPDLQLDSGKLAAWFTEPAGAVVQLTEAAVFTKAMAEWVVGPGFDTLKRRYPEQRNLRLLLDLRPMTSREPAARQVVLKAATSSLFLFADVGVVLPARPPPLYLTTLHAAVALLSAFGPEIRLFETIDDALAHMRLRAATSI